MRTAFSGRFRRFFDANFRHVVRNSAWSTANQAVSTAGVFLLTVVLARYFGRTDYGVYLIVVAYPEAVQLILGFRTREAVTKYLSEFLAREQREQAVAIVKLLWLVDLCVVVLAYSIVFVTAPAIAPRLTDYPASTELMRIYGLAMLFGGLDATAGSILRVFDRFRLVFLVGSTSWILRVLIIFALVAVGDGLKGILVGRVVGEVCATVIAATAALVVLWRALWAQRGARLSVLGSQKREITNFLLHTNVQASLRSAASKLDVIAVSALGGPGTVSLYKIGVQFGSSPLLLADPLFVSVYPQFARFHSLGERARIRSIGRRTSTLLGVLGIPIATLLAIWSEEIIVFLVGESYSEAWLPMVIVLIGVLPAVLLVWGRAAMLALGDAAVATRILSISIAAQFALLLLLVRPFGATGAAVGFAAMYAILAGLTLVYLRARELV